MKKTILLFLSVLASSPVFARSYDETVRLMKLNATAKCSLYIDTDLQTKEGERTRDPLPPRQYLFKDLSPSPSSSSDFAIYTLDWADESYAFYYYMNSQAGEIRIFERAHSLVSETDLDLSDMEKSEGKIGAIKLVQKQDVMVTDYETGKPVPGEKFTTLQGTCWKAN